MDMKNKNNDLANLLNLIDVVVDGKFVQSLFDEKIKFRGSTNQRIIDVQQSLKDNTIVELTF
jgi:anaerobic ribonucleoside-triphosphate reductase activating protein